MSSGGRQSPKYLSLAFAQSATRRDRPTPPIAQSQEFHIGIRIPADRLITQTERFWLINLKGAALSRCSPVARASRPCEAPSTDETAHFQGFHRLSFSRTAETAVPLVSVETEQKSAAFVGFSCLVVTRVFNPC
jgi:hypothetical protein